jgi:imidazolonepropionase-like amidohydrolase
MKLRTLATLLLGSFAALSAQADTVAIVHARAWTLIEDRPIEDATIVIKDGTIVSVASGGTAPSDARVIDAQGRTVTPGLMNAATYLGLVEVGSASETVDHRAKPGGPGAAFDVQYAINPNSALIRLARADGLTRAIAHPSNGGVAPFGGLGALLHLLEDGEVLEQPHIGLFATIGNRSAAASLGSRAAQWQALRTALDNAKAKAAAPATPAGKPGTADSKPPTAVPPAPGSQSPQRATDVAAAIELLLSGKIPLAISTNRESDVRQAARLARDYDIRVVIIGGADAWRAADELAAAKVAVVLDPMSNLPQSFDRLAARLDNATLLRKAGVVIAMSLDGVQGYNAGLSLREGAGLAVANGLPYIEALRSIISAPAEIWGVAERYGTLAPGKDGDIVIWDGDPLEPSSLAMTVLVRGREASMVTHQTELRDRYWPRIRAEAQASQARP